MNYKCCFHTATVIIFAAEALSQNPAGPAWWYEGDPPAVQQGIADVDNHAVANIGQGKWMTVRALASISDAGVAARARAQIVPAVFDDQAPQEGAAEQNLAPLNLGQLKAMAKPIYDEINKTSPAWVQGQLEEFGVTHFVAQPGLDVDWKYVEGGVYPWDPALTLDAVNSAPANLGQLKAVFCLDFSSVSSTQPADPNDPDGDGLTLDEEIAAGTSSLLADTDGDGLSDYDEINSTLTDPTDIDSDGDGIPDGGDEDPLARNLSLFIPVKLIVSTPLRPVSP